MKILRARSTPTTLAIAALASSLLVACGANEAGGSENRQVNDVDGLTVADDVPDDEVGDRFADRFIYPVSEGTPDPEQNWVDLYLPDTPNSDDATTADDSVPLVVYLHGGAWHSGAPMSNHIAETLTDRGVAVLNVEFRDVTNGGGWPGTYSDVADALDLVPSIDERYPELSTDDETIVGHSAGGQLAAWAGMRGDLEPDEVGGDPAFVPTRVISMSGPLDMEWAVEHGGDDDLAAAMQGSPDDLTSRYDSVDPIENIDPDVPVIAVHGTEDTLVKPQNSRRYMDAVNRVEGLGELVMLDGEGHNSYLKEDSDFFDEIIDLIYSMSTSTRAELEDRLNGQTTEIPEG